MLNDWNLERIEEVGVKTNFYYKSKVRVGALVRIDKDMEYRFYSPHQYWDEELERWRQMPNWYEDGHYDLRVDRYYLYEYYSYQYNYFNPSIEEIRVVHGRKASKKGIKQIGKKTAVELGNLDSLGVFGVVLDSNIYGAGKIDGLNTENHIGESYYNRIIYPQVVDYNIGEMKCSGPILFICSVCHNAYANVEEIFLEMVVEVENYEFGLMDDIILETDGYSEYLLKKDSGEYRTTVNGNYII